MMTLPQAHGAGDDQLRNDIGDQVLEDPAGDAEAAGLGGRHVLLLTQGQDLAADQTGDTSPAQEAQNQHQPDHSDLGVHAHAVHGRAQNDDDGHGGMQ